MKKFISFFKKYFPIFLMQIYSIVLFALFFSFIYLPYDQECFDLFPFYIYKVSWKAFAYYLVIYFCLWVFVELRINFLTSFRKQIIWKSLIVSNILIGLCAFPFLFFKNYILIGIIIIEFSILLFLIDFLWNSSKKLRFVYVMLVLFVFVNIVLLFVDWRNNLNQMYIANTIVNSIKNEGCVDYDVYQIPAAKYVSGKLVYNVGDFNYPKFYKFEIENDGFYEMVYKELFSHYIFRYGSDAYVVSWPSWSSAFGYFVNFTYVFTIYFIFTLLIYHVFARMGVVYRFKSFFSKIQYALVIFMLCFMFLILLLFSSYIGFKYIKMTRNTQLYRTEMFVNYFTPILNKVDDKNELLQKINRISEVLNTEIVIYGEDKEVYLRSDDAVYFDDNIRVNNPFETMTANIITEFNRYDNEIVMQSYTILFDNENKPLYTMLSTRTDRNIFDHEVALFIILVFNMYLFVMLISVFVSYFISKRFSAPLNSLEAKMKTVNLIGYNEKLEYDFTEDDALAKLVDQYNLLLDKLKESAERLSQSERESSWRNMARQIVHEINNPLTPMQLLSQKMRSMRCEDVDVYKEDVQKYTVVVLDCIENIKSITDLLSNFAKTKFGNVTEFDLVAKIRRVVELYENNDKFVQILFSSPVQSLILRMDVDMISQVLNNLITNAIQSIDVNNKNGVVIVSLFCDVKKVYISIKDNGVGISREKLNDIFKVSYTTKAKGMGLGLCVVKNMIELSSGTISVESEINVGTKFLVSFPLK